MVGGNVKATKQITIELQRDLGKLLSALHITHPTAIASTRRERRTTRNRIIEHADTIQDILAEGLRIATSLFSTKTLPPPGLRKQDQTPLLDKTAQRDVITLSNRAILLRRLSKLHITPPTQQDTPEANVNIINEIIHINKILTIPSTLEKNATQTTTT
jgi:hypothetical protein